MLNLKRQRNLVLDSIPSLKSKSKFCFEPVAHQKKKISFHESRPSMTNIVDNSSRRRLSTFHFNLEPHQQLIQHKRTGPCMYSEKKTVKSGRALNCFVSKRGARNFYILENQDYILTDQKNKDYRLYAVLDGHGKYGRLIAQTAANNLANKYGVDQKNVLKENQNYNTEKIMKNSILQTNKHLLQIMPKQSSNSGCTLLTILIRQQQIYCFNVGCSRAILAIKPYNEESLMAFPLSSDHKLSRFDEKFRIIQTKAVLQELKDQNGCRIGPQRIWKKGQKYPGIYITRSLGMKLSSELGIIPQPQTICIKIQQNFQFILACSDGFWEVFTNEEAIQYLIKYWKKDSLQEGIQNLMGLAVKKWEKKSELMDDISIVLIKL